MLSLQILIAAKANLNIKMVTGVTALTVALENKRAEAAALLKKAGAKYLSFAQISGELLPK